MRLPTKIPTIVGILLIVGIIAGIVTLEQIFRTPSNASGSEQPKQIHITNVSDSSFTVTWITQLATTGTVLVSTTGKSNQIYYDERDTTGKLGSFITHSVVVRDAKPATDYSLVLMASGRQYQDNDKPFAVHTAASIAPNQNGLEPAYGTVHSSDDRPVDGALIYLTVEGGQELSALSKPSGLWLIPLNQVRTADLTSYLPVVDRMTEKIAVEYQDQQATAVTDTLNDSPVPEMILGKSYDFRRQQAKTSGAKTIALRPTAAALPTSAVLGASTNRTFKVSLTSPAQGAALATTLPLIAGTGIPDKFVGISLGLTQIISGSTKVDANGLWNFTPPRSLAPGKQSVTMTTLDQAGKPVAITHSFEILKSGTQVLGDATPSATLEPTVTGTPIPTEILSASESATPTPTSTLSAEPPPNTGNELPTIMLILLGMGLLVSGAFATLK